MMYEKRESQRGNALLWIIGLIAIGVIVYFVLRADKPAAVVSNEAGNVPQEIVMEGEVVCLPHRDTSGPTTLECSYGLKGDDGNNYALDTTGLPATNPPEYNTGDRISVEGTMVPIEQISANFWQTYDIEGIIAVKDYWKFTEK